MLQFYATLGVFFSGPTTIRKHHKTFSCNCVVDPFISYFDPARLLASSSA